jgi:hypothetical protein
MGHLPEPAVPTRGGSKGHAIIVTGRAIVKRFAHGRGWRPSVRWSAAGALGQLRSGAALPLLLEAMKDTEAPVRRSAADALIQILSALPPAR